MSRDADEIAALRKQLDSILYGREDKAIIAVAIGFGCAMIGMALLVIFGL